MGYHILDYDIELVSEFGYVANEAFKYCFCVIAGDYVGEINGCSEWEQKNVK